MISLLKTLCSLSELFVLQRISGLEFLRFLKTLSSQKEKTPFNSDCKILEHPWQIFEYNLWAINQDFEMITSGRKSAKDRYRHQQIWWQRYWNTEDMGENGKAKTACYLSRYPLPYVPPVARILLFLNMLYSFYALL